MIQTIEKLLTPVSCALESGGGVRGLARRAQIWGGGSRGLQLPRLLLLSHDALHSPLLALQLPRCCVPLIAPLFLHHFYSGLALLALNGVVDDLLRHRWIMGTHWIIWTRYFVGLSFILLGVLWVRKEDLWCGSQFCDGVTA